MEQVRLLIAIGLSFIVLFVWSVYFTDQQPVQEQAQNNLDKKEIEKTESASLASETVKDKNITSDESDIGDNNYDPSNSRVITVDTPNYTVQISSKGAVFTSYILNKYREEVALDSPSKQIIDPSVKNGILQTSLLNQSIPNLKQAVYHANVSEDHISVESGIRYITFKWISDTGIIIEKTYGFDPESYLIDLKISLVNGSDRVLADKLAVGISNHVEDEARYGFVGPSAYIDDSLEEIKIKKIEDKSEYKGKIKWAGIEDRYFISAVIPDEEIEGSIKLNVEETIVTNELINPTFEIAPRTKKEFNYLVFMGPKSMAVLNNLGHDLGKALNFGFFDFIAKPCLWFMNQIHDVIPNYGIAIIILTIFTKIILWPLGTKSYKSMNDMKRLQPLMADIREKYKDDKQKMNQELMALYRTYKINPMGGCLPMVLQIPVFFALYRMLYQAIELRHAPFLLWINDLSAPDRLFDFGFSIPFMEPPYGIPVLTIIMGGTMLLQQKMSPPPGDPTQAKMMMFMPVVFTFIFINFSSGLVLYWLVNNVLSISQQYYVQKKAK